MLPIKFVFEQKQKFDDAKVSELSHFLEFCDPLFHLNIDRHDLHPLAGQQLPDVLLYFGHSVLFAGPGYVDADFVGGKNVNLLEGVVVVLVAQGVDHGVGDGGEKP